MPQKAEVVDPRGRTIEIEWDFGAPPTEAELEQMFASIGETSVLGQKQRFVPPLFEATPSSTSTTLFNPIPPKRVAPGMALRNLGGDIVETGVSALPWFLGPEVSIPLKTVTAFAGGATGNILNQMLKSGTQQELDVPTTLKTGQTEVKDVAFDPIAPLVSGTLNAATLGVARGPETMAARRVILAPRGFNKAVPAGKWELTRPEDLKRAAKYFSAEQRAQGVKIPKRYGDPSAMRQLAEEGLIKRAQDKNNAVSDAIINRNSSATISGDEIASRIETLQNYYTQNIATERGKSILVEANRYRGKDIPLPEANKLLTSLNEEIHGLYDIKKGITPAEQIAAVEVVGKPIAEMKKAADAVRELITDRLNQLGENGNFWRENRKDYGALARLEIAARGQITKAEAPIPPLFTERTGLRPSRPSILQEIGEQTWGRFNTPDKLLVRAMNRYGRMGLSPEGLPQGPSTRLLPGRLLPPRRGGDIVEGPSTEPPVRNWGTPIYPTNAWAIESGPVLPDATSMNVYGSGGFSPRVAGLLPEAKAGQPSILNLPLSPWQPPQTPRLLMRPTSGPQSGPSMTGPAGGRPGSLPPIPQPRSGEPRWGTQSELGRRIPDIGAQKVLPRQKGDATKFTSPRKGVKIFTKREDAYAYLPEDIQKNGYTSGTTGFIEIPYYSKSTNTHYRVTAGGSGKRYRIEIVEKQYGKKASQK